MKAGLDTCEVVDTVSQYVSAPMSVRVLGVDVDTSAAAESIADPARLFVKETIARLGDAVARTAEALGADEEIVAAPVPSSFPGAHAWMLTTYVDEDTRVARGEGGSVYLFEKIR
jgi:ABC-type hemin transport system substrate-binding protein